MGKPSLDRARRELATGAVALLLASAAALGAEAVEALPPGPAAASVMAPITVAGKVVKVRPPKSFILLVRSRRYVVKLDAMTHLMENHTKVALKKLAAGDHLTVKGHQDMGEITAASIVITGM